MEELDELDEPMNDLNASSLKFSVWGPGVVTCLFACLFFLVRQSNVIKLFCSESTED